MLDKLIVDTVQTPSPPDAPRLDVGAASEPQIVGALMRWFGDDAARRQVDLLRQGQPLGTVTRERLYQAAPDLTKQSRGFGASDNAMLPGVANYEIEQLICPQRGCGYNVMTIVLGQPPECPRHPGTPLTRRA